MNRTDYIRTEEKKYHDLCYEQYKLLEVGSLLYKPVKTVMDFLKNSTTCKYLTLAQESVEIVFQSLKKS